MEDFECAGINGDHEYVAQYCPQCGASNCATCAGFDSRGDSAHDADRPFMVCRECGQTFEI